VQALKPIAATENRPPEPPLPGDDAVTQAPVTDASSSVARNTLIMLASQIVTLATTLLWNVAVQSTLPAARFGQLFYAQSLALTGAVFMDMGIGTYLTKQVARERERSGRMLSTAISVRVFSTALIYTLIVLWALLDPSPHMDNESLLAVVLVGLAIVAASFTQACAATFQGNENMRWQALGNIAEKVSVMLVSVVLLWLGFGLVAVAAVMLGGALANLAVVGGQAARRGWVRPTFDRKLAWAMLRGGAPFFLWGAFGVIYQRNAALQLPRLVDVTVESWFGAAVRWYETLSFVPYIFQSAVLPVLARAFLDADDGMARTARRSFDLILLAALPISVGVVTLAPQLVALVGGLPKYAGAVDPLRVLGVSLVPLYVDMILATILISIDKQRAWAIVAIGAALLNPVANLWLIPLAQAELHNGAVGAAAVTLLTEVGIFCFNIFMIPRGVLGWHSAGFALRGAAAATAMGLALWLAVPLLSEFMPGGATSRLGAALLLTLAGLLGGAVFGGVAWALRLVGADEVRLVRRALRRGSVS
jgi:O-antigen/teichoic acid export membrane protein